MATIIETEAGNIIAVGFPLSDEELKALGARKAQSQVAIRIRKSDLREVIASLIAKVATMDFDDD